MTDTPAIHRDAAARHELAAENHERAARFWGELGDLDRAELQRQMAAHERHGAELERRWAELPDRGGQTQTGAAEVVVEHARHSARHLTAILMQIANTMDRSAQLAQDHAKRHQQAGRGRDAADERRAAERARDAAQQARSHAEQWLKVIENGEP